MGLSQWNSSALTLSFCDTATTYLKLQVIQLCDSDGLDAHGHEDERRMELHALH